MKRRSKRALAFRAGDIVRVGMPGAFIDSLSQTDIFFSREVMMGEILIIVRDSCHCRIHQYFLSSYDGHVHAFTQDARPFFYAVGSRFEKNLRVLGRAPLAGATLTKSRTTR